MKLQPIVDQLDGLGFRHVGGALEYVALKSLPGQLPAAYVIMEDEGAGENRNATGVIDQRVAVNFAVMLILEGNARREGKPSEQLDDLTSGVKDRLVGWTHPDASSPTSYVGGRMAGVDANAVIWAVRFRSSQHLRKTR